MNKNKVALVTGASRGIGKATCMHLAKKGYDVVVTARSVNEHDTTSFPGTITETAEMVRKLGRKALAIRCDVSSNDDIKRTFDRAMEAFGRIDVLVNNARYEGPAHWGAFTKTKWSEIEMLMRCNVFGVLYMSQLVVPVMRKQKGGVIITLASRSAQQENPNLPGAGSTGLFYPSSKAAINRWIVGLMKEVKNDNISVVNVSPGSTLTERSTVDEGGKRGYDFTRRHSVHVPATCITYIITCPDPMLFAGRVIEAPDFVREHFLMTPAELKSPFRDGEIYDPYKEPYWLKLKTGK